MRVPPRWARCAAVALLCAAPSAADPDPTLRPLPWQDPGPPARLFLQQPFLAPQPAASGFEVETVSANVFFSSAAPGGTQVQFDEETLTVALTGNLALGERLGLHLTIPVVVQYGGWLDPVLNAVEGAFNPHSARRQAPLYRIEASIVTASGGALLQSGATAGFGDVAFGAQELLVTGDGARPALAVRAAAKLPTGGQLAGSGTFDLGTGALLAWQLGWFGLQLGLDLGVPIGSLDPPGLTTRLYGSMQLGLAFRVSPTVGLHLQMSGHTSPLDVPDAPGLSRPTFYVLTGVGWQPSPLVGLHLALVENVFSPERGADYTVLLGVRFAFGAR